VRERLRYKPRAQAATLILWAFVTVVVVPALFLAAVSRCLIMPIAMRALAIDDAVAPWQLSNRGLAVAVSRRLDEVEVDDDPEGETPSASGWSCAVMYPH
jgi:hypothetical protein